MTEPMTPAAIEDRMVRDLDQRRVVALAKVGRMLGGMSPTSTGLPINLDLFNEVTMALGIEDAENIEIALEVAIEDPAGQLLFDRLARLSTPDTVGSHIGNGGGFDPTDKTPVEVTQADRENYLEYLRWKGGHPGDEVWIANLMVGNMDECHGVQISALYRHRLASHPTPGDLATRLREDCHSLTKGKSNWGPDGVYKRGVEAMCNAALSALPAPPTEQGEGA